MTVKEIQPGTILHGLRIEHEAGRGGSSIVYRATDLGDGRALAVKVLSAADPSSRRRLEREARLLATVEHRAIVPFRGLRQTEDRDILVTDWVDGTSLLNRIRQGPMSAEEALCILWSLAEPLDHLHSLDIVHRDISPSNIIIGPDEALTIIDLGIGHHVDSSTLTSEDLLAGTPKYLAPELIRGERASGRADQYGVGVIIHELISGQSPFPPVDKVATALHHQLYSAPVPLDEIDPQVPAVVADAVLRSLQKDPVDRFSSLTEFAEVASGQRSLPSQRVQKAKGSDEPRESRRLRPTRVMVASSAVILALAATAAVWQRSGAAPEDEAGATAGTSEEAPPAGQTGGGPQPSTLVVEAGSGDPAARGSTWLDGTAAGIGCNLLMGTTFADGSVPTDYFGDPPGRERVVTDVGFQQSWGLEVGKENEFGQYGEIVPIEPGQTYLFYGWFQRVGQIADAEIGISFLTTDYQPLSTGAKQTIPNDGGDFMEIIAVPAPEAAGFAVPYVFKDGSEGILMADELVFGLAEPCRADIGQAQQ